MINVEITEEGIAVRLTVVEPTAEINEVLKDEDTYGKPYRVVSAQRPFDMLPLIDDPDKQVAYKNKVINDVLRAVGDKFIEAQLAAAATQGDDEDDDTEEVEVIAPDAVIEKEGEGE